MKPFVIIYAYSFLIVLVFDYIFNIFYPFLIPRINIYILTKWGEIPFYLFYRITYRNMGFCEIMVDFVWNIIRNLLLFISCQFIEYFWFDFFYFKFFMFIITKIFDKIFNQEDVLYLSNIIWINLFLRKFYKLFFLSEILINNAISTSVSVFLSY